MVHLVEAILTSSFGLFVLGMGLTVVPVLGIIHIHKTK